MQKVFRIFAVLAFAALAACGDNLGEQAIIGGGVGGVAAKSVDGDVVTGVVVGAAANIAYCRRYPSRC
jgi:mannose/fructose/N-acetylgalactosamine-specific phosphotransferase system component IIC